MQVPLEISFEGLAHSDFVEDRIRDEVSKLEQFFDKIISCHVTIYLPHKQKTKGNLFAVRIYVTLPGGKMIKVDRHPDKHHAHEDPYVAIRDAFRAARRQLQERIRMWAGKVKTHENVPKGYQPNEPAD